MAPQLPGRKGVGPDAEKALDSIDPDAQLMLAFRQGDPTAFDRLFRRWSRPLLRYVERMVRDPASAEELVQETFIRVHGARERYTPEARFSTWLYRIATNLALNELRRPRRRRDHAELDAEGGPELADAAPSAEERLEARRRHERMEEALADLPDRQRAALWLVAIEGQSYAEVATALETTESSVKSLIHRARSTLADRMRVGSPTGPTGSTGGLSARADGAEDALHEQRADQKVDRDE